MVGGGSRKPLGARDTEGWEGGVAPKKNLFLTAGKPPHPKASASRSLSEEEGSR